MYLTPTGCKPSWAAKPWRMTLAVAPVSIMATAWTGGGIGPQMHEGQPPPLARSQFEDQPSAPRLEDSGPAR